MYEVSHYPELSLRTEPAHREAFVALPDAGDEAVHWHLAGESLEDAGLASRAIHVLQPREA